MKTKITLLSLVSVVAIVVLSAFSGTNTKNPTGAPSGYTNSPSDGQNCTNCHGGTPANVTGFISSDVPVGGYTPGTTYTITVAFSGTGKKGFEVSPQSTSGTELGSLIAGTGTHIVGTKYITHSSAITASAASWSFQWVAPAVGTGAVTFYGACVIAKPNTKLTTMVVEENISSGIQEIANTNLSFYPNPVNNILNVNYLLPVKTQVEINLYSIDGRKVDTFLQNEQNQGSYNLSFDVTKYSKGSYLVELKQNKQTTVKKIIIN